MSYKLNEYQADAMALRLESAKDPAYALFGLPGEVGEVCSLVAKAIRDGSKSNGAEMMKKELGDCMWFIAAIAADFDLTLEDVCNHNIEKLTSRKERGTLQGSGDNR